MADLISEKKKPLRKYLVWGGGAAAAVVLGVIALLVFRPSASGERSATPAGNQVPVDITGIHFGFSQLANYPPLWWQMSLVQVGSEFTGEFRVFPSGAGQVKGNLDSQGRLQFVLTQSSKGDDFLSQITSALPFLGGGEKVDSFTFIGYYKKADNNVELFGEVQKQNPANDVEAKRRKFYSSMDRPNYWAKQ